MARKLFLLLFGLVVAGQLAAQNLSSQQNQTISPSGFLQNQGQFTDQNGKPRPEIHFVYQADGAKLLLRQNGFSIEQWHRKPSPSATFSEATGKEPTPHTYQFHRVDVDFHNANPNAEIAGQQALPTRFNYYLAHTPEEGITSLRSYRKVVYRNIYPHIDIEFLLHTDTAQTALGVKYNIVVKPGGKLEDVQLDYQGVENLKVLDSQLQYNTSLGIVHESLPYSYQLHNGRQSPTKITYQNHGGLIGFEGSESVLKDTLVVDPVFYHTWKLGTYFGSDKEDESYSVTTNDTNYIYITGQTNGTTSIATSGTHQGTHGGQIDAFVAKFNSSLTRRIWGSYFGGKSDDSGLDIAIDSKHDLYITGVTKSSLAIATTSSHQGSLGASQSRDAFLLKMDSSGSRSWSTYYGGSGEDYGHSVDVSKNFVVIVGKTKSTNGRSISTLQSHQTAHGGASGYNDGFIAQFDKNGSRKWATYYGGNREDILNGVIMDAAENIYAVGHTESDNGKIATTGTHQTSLDDDHDVFLVKLNKSGTRVWGTYYGDEEDDFGNSIDVNSNGKIIYITGTTESSKGIHSGKTHQSSKGSGADSDAFLASFDDKGKLNWGTYYGGNGVDEGRDVDIDIFNNVVITGITKSTNNMAVARAYQKNHSGYFDGFLAKFKPNGTAHWTTYYGIQQEDEPFGVTTDPNGFMIMTGFTRSTSGISHSKAYQVKHNSANDAFIAKFCDIIITQHPQNKKVWIGNSVSFNVKHIGTKDGAWKYQWYKDGTALSNQNSLNLNINKADSSSPGYYILKISNDCGTLWTDSAKLTVCSYTPPKRICKGESTTVTFARQKGASYKWSPNYRLSVDTGVKVTLSPYKTTDYTVTITQGTSSSTVKFTVTVKDIPPADAGADVTICSGKSAQLGSTACSGCTYSWSPSTLLSNGNVSNPVFKTTVTSKQTYTFKVTVTKAGCDSTDDVKVTVNPLPNINPGSNRSICINNGNITLSGSPIGGRWRGTGITNAANGTFSPSVADTGKHTLYYRYTDGNACVDSASIDVTVKDTPTVNAGNDVFFCNTATRATLNPITSGGTWSGHSQLTSAGIFNPKNAKNGTYEVYYSKTTNGCTNVDTIQIKVGSPTVASAGKDTTVCLNSPVFVLLPSGSWSGTGVSNGKFDPNTAGVGKHKVTYTIGTGTCLSTDDKFVTVDNLPSISLGSSIAKCLNHDSFDLKNQASPTGGYWWGKGITDSVDGTFNPQIAGTGNHDIHYRVTNSKGCTDTSTLRVTVNDTPSVEAYPLTACSIGGNVALKSNPSSGGTWSGKYVSGTNFQATVAGTGKYIVAYTITNSNKCSSTDTALINIISAQSINAGVDDTFCINHSSKTLTPTVTGGTWSGKGISGSTFSPSLAKAGRHELIYSIGSGSCLNRDTLYMQVYNLPVVKAGNDIDVCIDSDTIKIGTGYPSGGLWTGKGVQQTNSGHFVPVVADTGNHYALYTYTDGNGCLNQDSLEISVHALPKPLARDTQVCSIGGKVQLSGKPSNGTWSGHKELGPNGQFDVTKAGVAKHEVYYTVSETHGQIKCVNVDTAVVDVIVPKTAEAGANFTFCVSDVDKVLSGRPAGGKWSGTGMTDSTFSPSKAGDGTHWVYYTYGSGTCQNTDSARMLVHPLPTVDAGPKAEACISDDSLQLKQFSPTSGGVWRGTTFHDTVKGIFSPSTSGIKTHKVYYHFTNTNGCHNFDSTEIEVHGLPTLSVPDSLQLCNQPFPITLSGSPTPGKWTGKNISQDSIYTPNGVDTHYVYYSHTDANGCSNRDSTKIKVINPVFVSTAPDDSICHLSGNVTFTASPTGGSWTGRNVNSSGVFTPKDTGIHKLVYSLGIGSCQTFDTLKAYVVPLPKVEAGPLLKNCESHDTFLLDTTSYYPLGGIWNGKTIVDTSLGKVWPGAYPPDTTVLYYRYTDSLTGCVNYDTTSIIVNKLPVVRVADTTICNQPLASQFYGSPLGGTWSQNGITSSGSFTPLDTGIFPVIYTYTDANGCTNYDTMQIEVVDPVNAKAVVDFEICIFNQTTLTGSPVNGWWTGPDILPNGQYAPDSAGDIELYYSFGIGTCLTRDTTKVKVHALPTPSVSGPLKLCTNDSAYTFQKSATPVGGWFTGAAIQDSVTGRFDPLNAGLGTHTVYYHYVDPKTQCYNLDSHKVKVNGLPALSFNLDSVLCVKTKLSFNNGSSGGNTYQWNFGDGSGWTQGFSPSHTYQDTGRYQMEVIGTTPDGCSDTFNQTFYVVDPPKARFGLSPKKGCGPLNVKFTDYTAGRFLTYQWAFETGDTIRKQELDSFSFPFYPYDSITYTLELKVTNVCRSDYWYDSVTVYPSPTANIHIEPKIGCTPLVVTMRDKSYGLPDKRQYNFGDGKFSSRTDTVFDYTYYTDSTRTVYQFSFNTQNICGADTQYTDIVVKPNFLRAFFELDTNQGCTPFQLQAVDHHKGNASVSWQISDGKTFGQQDTIQHELTEPGTYTVVQMLDNGCARDTFRSQVVVHQSPRPDFTIDSTSTCLNIDVHFKNLTPNVSGTTWEFGDRTTSLLPAPSHRFPKADTFSVKLSVVGNNEFQCPASISKPIIILPLPHIVVNPVDTFGCRELEMTFISQSTNARFYQWLMNDGTNAEYAGDSIRHTFPDSGVFVSQLIAESPKGCVDTGQFVTRVYARPEAGFTTDSSLYCDAPHAVQFTNTTRFGNAYKWNFDDGTTSVSRSPQHVFQNYDTFQVTLIAENRYRCRDTFRAPIELIRTPVIDVVPDPKEGCEPVLAHFVNHTRFADSFFWQHSDGRIKNDTSPVFRLNYTGQPYAIKLVASHRRTCFDSMEWVEPVKVWPKPISLFSYNEIIEPKQHGKFVFESQSPNMRLYRWDYGDDMKGQGVLDTHRFAYRDSFLVQHFVTNEFGCLDTASEWVQVEMYGLFVPNTMLVDGSDKGYVRFAPQGVGLKDYKVEIFTTWGELVWESTVLDNNRPAESWNGTHHISGKPLDEDAYVWSIEATFLNDIKWQGMPNANGQLYKTGTITIIR